MEDTLNGANGLTVLNLVVGVCVCTQEIAPIQYQETTEKLALNRTWDRLKNHRDATPRTVVRKPQLIFFPLCPSC